MLGRDKRPPAVSLVQTAAARPKDGRRRTVERKRWGPCTVERRQFVTVLHVLIYRRLHDLVSSCTSSLSFAATDRPVNPCTKPDRFPNFAPIAAFSEAHVSRNAALRLADAFPAIVLCHTDEQQGNVERQHAREFRDRSAPIRNAHVEWSRQLARRRTPHGKRPWRP